MRYLALLALLGGCGWDITRPPQRCYWKYTKFAAVTDTVWNRVPNNGNPAWTPYVLVTRDLPSDSTRECP